MARVKKPAGYWKIHQRCGICQNKTKEWMLRQLNRIQQKELQDELKTGDPKCFESQH